MSKFKSFFLETRKCLSFHEIRGYFQRSLMSKLNNFLTLRPNHGGLPGVTTFTKFLNMLPPHFLKLDNGSETLLLLQ